MAATIKIAILANAKNAIKGFQDATGAARTAGEKIRSGFKSAAVPAIGALGAIGGAAFKFGQDASEMSDSVSAIETVLGPAAKTILDFSDTTASALGISKQTAIDAGLAFGNIGKTAGLQGPELATFTTDLIGRAGDVASQLGGTSQEAVEAFGSALRGEFEPARKYGVLLNESSLMAEALSLGLVKAKGDVTQIKAAQIGAATAQNAYTEAVQKYGVGSAEAKVAQDKLALANAKLATSMKGKLPAALTVQQKALAAQSAILKQTSAAAGDFSKTSDSAKNQQEKLKAELANTSAELGKQLLPMMSATAAKLGEVLGWVKENQGAVKVFVGIIAGLAAVIMTVNAAMSAYAAGAAVYDVITKVVGRGTKAWAGSQWGLNLAFLANPLTWIIVGIIALIAVVVLIATKTTWFQTIWRVVWGGIKTAAVAVFNFLASYFSKMFAFYKMLFFAVVAGFKRAWSGIVWLWDKAGAVMGAIQQVFVNAFNWVRGRIANFIANVRVIWAGIIALVTKANEFKNKIITVFVSWLSWMLGLPKKVIDGLLAGLKAGWAKITEFFDWAIDLIPSGIKRALGLASPSKVMAGLGANITGGLVQGIVGEIPALRKAMAAVSGVVADGVTGDTAGVLGGGHVTVTGAPGGAGAGAASYVINVNVAPGADLAEAGRQTVKAIEALERQTGRRRLVATTA